MNYQTEIRMFNEWLETHELTASGIALWYAFMFMAYRSGWPTEEVIPVSALCLRSKLSRSAVYKERNMLRDYGLIDFDTTSGRRSTRYRIRSFEARLVATKMSATRTQTETGAIIPAEDTSEMSTVVSMSRTQSGKPPDAEEEMSTTKTQPWTQIPAGSEMSALVSTRGHKQAMNAYKQANRPLHGHNHVHKPKIRFIYLLKINTEIKGGTEERREPL